MLTNTIRPSRLIISWPFLSCPKDCHIFLPSSPACQGMKERSPFTRLNKTNKQSPTLEARFVGTLDILKAETEVAVSRCLSSTPLSRERFEAGGRGGGGEGGGSVSRLPKANYTLGFTGYKKGDRSSSLRGCFED